LTKFFRRGNITAYEFISQPKFSARIRHYCHCRRYYGGFFWMAKSKGVNKAKINFLQAIRKKPDGF